MLSTHGGDGGGGNLVSTKICTAPNRLHTPAGGLKEALAVSSGTVHSNSAAIVMTFTFPTFIMAQSQLTLESMKFWDYRFDILIRPNEWAVGSQFCSGKNHFVQAIGPF